MYPPRLGINLLLALMVWFAGVSPSFAQQRRVFTNEDFPSSAPPPAAPAPGAESPSAEGTPATEGKPSESEPAEPESDMPPALKASNDIQITLREFHSQLAAQLDQETDPGRQERLRLMMDLAAQLLSRNIAFISEIKAQQEAQKEAEAQAQGGAAPAQ